VAACLAPLAVWILLSGLDDVLVSLVWAVTGFRRFSWPADCALAEEPQRRIAIFVPLWREHAVIGQMLDHNLAAIRYRNFDVFVGVYPNDLPTCDAVAAAERQHGRVHMATVPHDGPTSKGDCLNAIYRHMLGYESRYGVRFDVIVTHDAEDLVHPESLRFINWYMRDHQMVQVPVLALPTGMAEFTHGLYCDEFAEYQSKDIPVRQTLGGFLPSNGVGTGFDRGAVEQLAALRGGEMFDPSCLTEDYETGYRMHHAGYRQIFVPLRFRAGEPVATREYFPRRFAAAVRQRSRWVTGIALQGWQRHGWALGTRQTYWFWRDRKGLIGNLLSPLVNLVFVYGVADPHLRLHVAGWMWHVSGVTAAIALVQMSCRALATGRVYGWRFATGVPLRMLWGNLVNCLATAAALRQFAVAAVRREQLSWRKTEHVYPAYVTHGRIRPRLGEVLVRMSILPMHELESALRTKPPAVLLGEHLLGLQKISQGDLHMALTHQESGD
jgi:bacteriophage N4 adsorption protein B